jgi:hypothetical protein
MKEVYTDVKAFVVAVILFTRSVYSESDGTGSSSRILMTILATVASAILWGVFKHIEQLTDVAAITAWLASIPIIISALVMFFTAPYGVNKASSSFTDILNSLRRKDQQ